MISTLLGESQYSSIHTYLLNGELQEKSNGINMEVILLEEFNSQLRENWQLRIINIILHISMKMKIYQNHTVTLTKKKNTWANYRAYKSNFKIKTILKNLKKAIIIKNMFKHRNINTWKCRWVQIFINTLSDNLPIT